MAKKMSPQAPEFNLLQCKKCRLCFVDPIPAQEVQESFFKAESAPVSRRDITRFNKKVWRFKLAINKLSLQLFRGYKFYPVKNNLLLKILIWPCTLVALKNMIHFQGQGRILDVGCNTGMYLAILKELGWETYGVEPEASLYNEAKKRAGNVFNGTLEQAEFPDKYFDVIRFNQVFEHIPDPIATLAEVKRILSDDGLIYIEVPNQKSFSFYAFGEDFYGCPMHLNIFSPETITLLCAKLGLKVKRIKIRSSPGLITNCLKARFKRRQTKFKKIISPFIPWGIIRAVIIKPFCFILQLAGVGDIFEAEISKN